MANLEKTNFLVQIISINKLIRSKNLIDKLAAQNIEFKFSAGVIPDQSQFDSGSYHYIKISQLICQRKITKSEVGCALAHQKAQQNFLDSGTKYGIIFEDDAELIQAIDFNVVDNYLDNTQPRILIFGWIPGYAITHSEEIQNDSNLLSVVVPPTCAFAYAINRPAAKILTSSKKVADLADWPIYTFNKIEYAIVDKPWAEASQDPSQSIIGIRQSTINVTYISRLRGIFHLLVSLFGVFALSKINKLNISLVQILNRMVLKDFYYNYGVKIVKSNDPKVNQYGIVNLPIFQSKLIRFLKLDKLIQK